MKYFLTIAIAVLTVFANGDLTAQGSTTPPCRAGTLDLRAGHLSGNPRLSGAFNSLSGETYDPIEEEGLSVITIEGGGMDLEQGKNNIYYTSTDTHQSVPPLIISSYNAFVNLGDVDKNWWGVGIDPYYIMHTPCPMPCSCEFCWWNTAGGMGTEDDAGGFNGGPNQITYSSTSGGTLGLLITDSSSIPNTAACPTWASYFGDEAKKGNIQPMSVTDDTENCDSLRFKIWDYSGPGQTQQVYDTTMKFIETCYNNSWAPSMFQYYTGARQPLEEADTSLWLESQLWLESVLYLNTTNPEYFCACVEAMQVCAPTDTGGEVQGWKNLNKGLAVLKWLIQNTTCDTPTLQNEFYGARSSQYQSWLNDTTVPFDTTIPSIASLGLGLDTLLARHLLYEGVSDHSQSIILNATASPNPVSTGTVITFGISQEAYVKINLFDLLGAPVSGGRVPGSGGEGFEGLFAPGNHEVPLSLQGLPSGTYFARILTAYGNVATVKLVKE